jgi:malonyl-CoA/methylmalonyl-CoA synthetase
MSTPAAANGPMLVRRATEHVDRVALIGASRTVTYGDLLDASARAAADLVADQGDLRGGRVAFLTHPSIDYVTVQWGIWRAGGVGVPLGTALPPPELRYALADAGATVAVADDAHRSRLEPLAAELGIAFRSVDDLLAPADTPELPEVSDDRGALVLYTSGTTGRPKGVLHTHASLAAQCASLSEAWAWSPEDRIALVLPLHHVHGIVNVVGCALWNGATCELLGSFDAGAAWERIAGGEVTLFMAVPTIYRRLIDAWDAADPATRERWSAGARVVRLMVSGSAALPVPTLDRWRELTGHVLLERYGMTEFGMALSNTLDRRVPGHVGWPLPGVEVRLVGDGGTRVAPGEPGQIMVRSRGMFREYWKRPEATAAACVDGWFATGDVAVASDDGYRILGRQSVDIIKTGGEKVSALEIEEVLRRHPAVTDCAVVGLPDTEWGERVAAAVVVRPGTDLDLEALRAWAKQHLAAYKAPTRIKLVADLPRNALGKVTKPDLVATWGTR